MILKISSVSSTDPKIPTSFFFGKVEVLLDSCVSSKYPSLFNTIPEDFRDRNVFSRGNRIVLRFRVFC
ncbi:hypothetical protein AAC387_Pa07g2871 [Persea americana]